MRRNRTFEQVALYLRSGYVYEEFSDQHVIKLIFCSLLYCIYIVNKDKFWWESIDARIYTIHVYGCENSLALNVTLINTIRLLIFTSTVSYVSYFLVIILKYKTLVHFSSYQIISRLVRFYVRVGKRAADFDDVDRWVKSFYYP